MEKESDSEIPPGFPVSDDRIAPMSTKHLRGETVDVFNQEMTPEASRRAEELQLRGFIGHHRQKSLLCGTVRSSITKES